MMTLAFFLALSPAWSITAYTHTGDPTASGRMPVVGVTVACPRSLPFGTRVWIEGMGERRCDDRIGHGADFDIFVGSKAEAIRWGRRSLKVVVR